jgi:hypothetical protein
LITSDLDEDTAAFVWKPSYDSNSLNITGAESFVFASTQVKMKALISAFEYIALNASGNYNEHFKKHVP